MKRRTLLFTLASITLLVTLITGCGSGTPQDDHEQDATLTGQITQNTEVEPDASGDNIQNTEEAPTTGEEAPQDTQQDRMMDIYRADITGDFGDNETSENKENEDWCYTIYKNDQFGCVHVYQYKGTDRNIVIPDTFEGYPVTKIVDPRMYIKFHYDADLTSFTRAYDISEVTGFQIPDTVYSIHDQILPDTAWYASQPDGEIYIGNVFYRYKGEMPQGTVFELREGTLGINEQAFDRCDGLQKVIMPDSLVWISDLAFSSCTSLSDVQLSSSLIGMRMYVFDDTPSLKEIYLPKSLVWGFQTLDDPSIEKVYYEGSGGDWLSIKFDMLYRKEAEVECGIPFPY